MRLTADVGGEDDCGRLQGEGCDLVGQQALRQLGLQDGVGACGTAAQMGIRDRREFEAEIGKQGLDFPIELEAVLQGAGRVKGDPGAERGAGGGRRERMQFVLFGDDDFTDIPGQFRDAPGFPGISAVLRQQVAVVPDHHSAAAGSRDDGLGALFDMRPPGIDIAPDVVPCFVLRIQVKGHRAATAGLRRLHQGYAEPVEHARGGGVGRGRERGLHATIERQHFARVLALRPRPGGCGCARHLALEGRGQQSAHELSDFEQGLEQRAPGNDGAQGLALQGFETTARHLRCDEMAADVEQPCVLHA